MKNKNAEIIAVGTEILLGQIANTNAQWISKQLALDGINVLYHEVVGDNLSRVKQVFKQAEDRADIIIVTGGLGPTEDDLTREAFQMISGLNIIEHQPSMNKISDYYKKQGLQMTDNNRKQARVFQNAEIIENEIGMAPGMIINHAHKTWIFLPGVPSEMKQMMLNGCLPYLRKKFGQDGVIRSKVLRFIGIGEAKLEDELKELIEIQSNPTIALLAQNDGIIIRLTAKAETEQTVNALLLKTQTKIEEKVGSYLYGTDDQTIEHKIASMLEESELSLSAAESLTGGKFTEKIISVPGASNICPGSIVCYNQQIKTDILGVPKNVINDKGTVSLDCAESMAVNVLRLMGSNIGIGFTGVAGPDSSEGHQPGSLFISVCNDQGEKITQHFILQGNRETIRHKAVLKGFEMLYYFLKKHY